MSAKHPDFFTPIDKKKSSSEFPEFFSPVEETSRTRSLLSAFPKGLAKGVQSLVSMSPVHPRGPIPEKLEEKLIEKLLPTQEKIPEQLLERGGKLAPLLAGGEASIPAKMLRGALGAISGQTTKELGGGPIAQDIAELSSLAFPDLAKSIPAKASQKRVIDFLRGKGYTENEITPFLKNPKKLARLGKFASKSEKTKKLTRDIFSKFDNVYEGIRESGSEVSALSPEATDAFLDGFQSKMDKIPRMFRRMIKDEVDDLLNSEMKFTDFLDFQQALNARIGSTKGGKAVLGILKEPVKEAQRSISPELTADLELANRLYSKGMDISKHLSPNILSDLLGLGEVGTLIAGIGDANLGIIQKVLGVAGARKLAQEMLINPRLQNLSKRMLQSIKNNNLTAAKKILDIFNKEAEESIPKEPSEQERSYKTH